MQSTILPTRKINNWKAVALKQQLHYSIIKVGYAPSHALMNRVTIITKEEEECLVEEFYLDHQTEHEKFLLRSSFLHDEAEGPLLIIERENCSKLQICFSDSLQTARV